MLGDVRICSGKLTCLKTLASALDEAFLRSETKARFILSGEVLKVQALIKFDLTQECVMI